MRKATLIATALIAVLALSVGALAYPVVVGIHPLSTAHAATPAAGDHSRAGDDNSTVNGTHGNETGDHGNETGEHENETGDNETGDHQGAPGGNETGNETQNETEMASIHVAHNVTMTTVDNTTYVNGTITVSNATETLIQVTFQIVVHDNGTANVTFNDTSTVGSTVVDVRGIAFYTPESQSVEVFGLVTGSSNGSVQWARFFAFEAPSSGCPDP